jgi:hypothetical protein
MSVYDIEPIDLSGLRTISIAARGGKVSTAEFARPYTSGSGIRGLLEGLPRILAAEAFQACVESILEARRNGRQIIWAMGGHVVKCGLAPVLIDLMRRGCATAFAMNGSASIHDFEIAIAGQTSEDVEAVLPGGRFGVAEETGREWNCAVHADEGLGEALGRALDKLARPEYVDSSLLVSAWRARTPVTVHVAFGTDTPHMHPAIDPAKLGTATHRDFRLFCSLVAGMHDGGVFINAGSAVVMPEVFLKAVSCIRNPGGDLSNFTTINMDFIQHYRPRVNVVERPHAGAGGRGIALTGHHEIMIPLLAAALIERIS